MANYCPYCAQHVTDDMRVCPRCGTGLEPTGPPPDAWSPRPYRADPGASPRYADSSYDDPAAADPRDRARGADFGQGPGYAPLYPEPYDPSGYGLPYDEGASRPMVRYPKAPLTRRLLAWMVDWLVQLAAFIPALFLFLAGAFGKRADMSGTTVPIAAGMLALFIGLAWTAWYGFTKDGAAGGAGIGKRTMGLMVVHLPDNMPCTRGQSATRVLIKLLTNLIPGIGTFVEPVLVLAAADGRRLGDKVAMTQVIAAEDYEP